ncbi:MAG: hypothetical protein Q9159_000891 [Coniocarpon cinnabarinum]
MDVSTRSTMRKLLTSGEGADFTIHCQGEALRVHKFVLQLRSDYFKTLFSSTSSDQYEENSSNELTLEDEVDLDSLKGLLQIMYTDAYDLKAIVQDSKNLKEWNAYHHKYFDRDIAILALADRFQVKGIEIQIIQHLFICDKDCIMVYEETNNPKVDIARLREDKAFVDGLAMLYQIAHRNGDSKADRNAERDFHNSSLRLEIG